MPHKPYPPQGEHSCTSVEEEIFGDLASGCEEATNGRVVKSAEAISKAHLELYAAEVPRHNHAASLMQTYVRQAAGTTKDVPFFAASETIARPQRTADSDRLDNLHEQLDCAGG